MVDLIGHVRWTSMNEQNHDDRYDQGFWSGNGILCQFAIARAMLFDRNTAFPPFDNVVRAVVSKV